jgi:hypothetical protein
MRKLFQQIIENPAFGFVWGLVGYLIGNRFAIDRDRRKEFNSLIDPVRHDLLGMRNHPGSSIKGAWMITFKLIREKLPLWDRKGFDRAVENYKKSKGDGNRIPDGAGGFNYKDTASIVSSIDCLLRYLKPK